MASSSQSGVCSQSKYMPLGGCFYAIAISLIALCACILALPTAQAFAIDGAPSQNLVAAQPASNADFYAVLHEDGTLVFQKTAPSDNTSAANVKAIYEGSLAGYDIVARVPWLADATLVKTVEFAEDFAQLQPQSLKFWFMGCENLTTIDLENLDASCATNTGRMFMGCSSLVEIKNLSKFDTSSSTYFGSMFNGCASLKSLDVSHFDATNVTYLCFMFQGCTNLETLNMAGPGWKTSSLGLMVHVWEGCSSLKSLDLSYLDTTHVGSMAYDFNGCSSLEYLDLSGVDTSGIEVLAHMFDGCTSLSVVKLGPKFSFAGTAEERQCTLPEGNWISSTTGMVYASGDIPDYEAATYTKEGGSINPGSNENEGTGENGTSEETDSSKPHEKPNESVDANAETSAKASLAKGIPEGKLAKVSGNTYKVTNNKNATVMFQKAAKSRKTITVPATVTIKGKKYAVVGIAKGAFKGAAAKTVIVKTKKLTKTSVKKCFKGAKRLKTVKAPSGKKRAYKLIFKKTNSGKAVAVR